MRVDGPTILVVIHGQAVALACDFMQMQADGTLHFLRTDPHTAQQTTAIVRNWDAWLLPDRAATRLTVDTAH